jgi:hypothetical protein
MNVQAETPSVWQNILGSVTKTIGDLGSAYLQGRTALEVQKMQLRNQRTLQAATVSTYGTPQTIAAIEATNQARILDATERARLAEMRAGTTAAPIFGGMSSTTLLMIAGAVGLGLVALSQRKGK